MTIANILTSLRIVMAPFCVAFIVADVPFGRIIAFGIYVCASLTDALDGYFARRMDKISDFGKYFDPLADKILNLSVLVSLAFTINALWCWTAVVIIAVREVTVALIRRLRSANGISRAANNNGKIKTWVQIVAVCALILEVAIAPYLLWLAVVVSLYSGIFYVNIWVRRKYKPQQEVQ
jgi:CDP-diacylglycerol--glycerol-3-phosphate 3-phosphatidyltransferase